MQVAVAVLGLAAQTALTQHPSKSWERISRVTHKVLLHCGPLGTSDLGQARGDGHRKGQPISEPSQSPVMEITSDAPQPPQLHLPATNHMRVGAVPPKARKGSPVVRHLPQGSIGLPGGVEGRPEKLPFPCPPVVA